MRTQTALFIGQIIGLLSVVSIPIALNYYSHALPTGIAWERVGDLVVYAHLLFLMVFIAVLVRGLDKNNTGSYRARRVHEKLGGEARDHEDLEVFSTRQVGRFKRHFLRFWCAMLCLYFVFAIQPIFSVAADDGLKALSLEEMLRRELFPILAFILNNISLIFIFCCFSVLHLPKEPTLGNSKAPLVSGLIRRFVKGLSDPELEEFKLRQRTLAWSVIFGIVALTLTFPLIMLTKIGVATNWSEYPAVFDALSGTINAIALALLVARLDSKLIGLPSWLICILYVYAGVQPMFVVFELHPEVYAGIKTAVLLVVFIFKIYFFLIIFYSLQTGRMFNYFFCSRILNEQVKKLKEDALPENKLKTQPSTTVEEKSAEPSITVSAQKPATEVEADPPVTPVHERRLSSWLRKIGVVATGFSKSSKGSPRIASETPPAATVEVRRTEPSVEISPHQSAKKSERDRPVTPVKKDWRAVWFKRLGVAAIFLFAGSLLTYVSLSEAYKFRIDSSGLSHLLILLHVVLLVVICFWVFFARYRETRRGSRPREKARARVRAELRFKLADPGSPKARKRIFKELSRRTERQFKAFTLYFRLFWLSMLLLYVAMWFSGTYVPDIPPQPIPVAVASTTEGKVNLPGRSEVGAKGDFSRWSLPEGKPAYAEHNQTAPKGDHKSETTASQNSEPSAWSQGEEHSLPIDELPGYVTFSFAFFAINNFTVLTVFLCFTFLYIAADDAKFEEKRRLLRNYALLICVLLTVLVPLLGVIIKGNGFTPSEVEKIPTILGAVGGTLNAVAFALLIARLDSRIIGLPLLSVTILYAYASLQPLFVTFNQPSKLLQFIATSTMIAAFIFKVCLVLMVGHVRRSGGLIDYLWFFPVVSNSVNAVFGNQFEVKAYSPEPGSFTFLISNKNVETYRAVEMYTTRAQCDVAIKTLVEAMKQRGNYSKPSKELQGTYWVQVKSDDHLICESIGLRSQAEVDELITESIEKVPYCKYDRG